MQQHRNLWKEHQLNADSFSCGLLGAVVIAVHFTVLQQCHAWGWRHYPEVSHHPYCGHLRIMVECSFNFTSKRTTYLGDRPQKLRKKWPEKNIGSSRRLGGTVVLLWWMRLFCTDRLSDFSLEFTGKVQRLLKTMHFLALEVKTEQPFACYWEHF